MTARFRLEAVLRLRRTLRDECEARAAEANRVSARTSEIAAQRLAELRRTTVTGGDVRSFRSSAVALEHRAAASFAASLTAEDARAAHRARLDELVRASMAVSALERLEQRALDAMKAEERRCEIREIDDLVAARYARSGRRTG